MRLQGIHLFAKGPNGSKCTAAAPPRTVPLPSCPVYLTRNASEQRLADRCAAVNKQRLAGDETGIF
jgi:hypothetical protein